MVSNISQIVYQLFQKETLEEVSESELRYYVKQYPFSGTGHLLLAKKLQIAGEKRALERETAVAALYFSNPAWLQYVLSEDRMENTSSSHQSFFVEHTDSGNTNLLIPEYNEEPVNQDPVDQKNLFAAGASYPEPIVVPGLEISSEQAKQSSTSSATETADRFDAAETEREASPGFDIAADDHQAIDLTINEAAERPAIEAEQFKNDEPSNLEHAAIDSDEEGSDGVSNGLSDALSDGVSNGLSNALSDGAGDGDAPDLHNADKSIASTEAFAPISSIETSTKSSSDESDASDQIEFTNQAKPPVAETSQQEFADSEEPILTDQVNSDTASLNSEASDTEASVESVRNNDTDGTYASTEAHASTVTQPLPEANASPGPESSTEPQPRITISKPADNTEALPKLEFDPYHTIDYFASQGIKLRLEDYSRDKLGQQLKSFTEWIRSMKRLPQQQSENNLNDTDQHSIRKIAEHSVEEKEVLTESMAEVWAKQGNYEKARQIYRKLSLQNPSKSTYFAAKIEQLKVL